MRTGPRLELLRLPVTLNGIELARTVEALVFLGERQLHWYRDRVPAA